MQNVSRFPDAIKLPMGKDGASLGKRNDSLVVCSLELSEDGAGGNDECMMRAWAL